MLATKTDTGDGKHALERTPTTALSQSPHRHLAGTRHRLVAMRALRPRSGRLQPSLGRLAGAESHRGTAGTECRPPSASRRAPRPTSKRCGQSSPPRRRLDPPSEACSLTRSFARCDHARASRMERHRHRPASEARAARGGRPVPAWHRGRRRQPARRRRPSAAVPQGAVRPRRRLSSLCATRARRDASRGTRRAASAGRRSGRRSPSRRRRSPPRGSRRCLPAGRRSAARTATSPPGGARCRR